MDHKLLKATLIEYAPIEVLAGFMGARKEKEIDMKKGIQIIADHYGKEHQSTKAMEELAELIQAVSKSERKAILEEIADACVMIEQLMYFHDISIEEVEAVMDIKIARQIQRIKSEG